MTDQLTNALLAGGGIGGLTTSLCLARTGLQVTVLEQSPVFGEAGAGIQLSPNCARVLHHLGLEGALRDVAFLPEGAQFRHWRTGRVISESVLGEQAERQYGAPYYHIHRGDLLQLLLDAARRAGIELLADTRVSAIEQNEAGVRISAGDGSFTSGLLVGADGIHSVVREQLWGEDAPRFTGNLAWRALVPADRLPAAMIRPMATAWWGPGKHFVHYYVRGGELVNCVCVVEKAGWQVESWTQKGDLDELRADFSGWHSDIETLIDRIDEATLFKWALFDRDPLAHWGQGRVTLLGDACHPMLPFMAQGAAMAIEDAAVLANCVGKNADVPQALARYENLRKDRTASIQRGSRRNARVFHLSGLPALLRNRAVRAAGTRTMDRLYSYNPLKEFGSE